MTVFASHQGEESHSILLDPVIRSWSDSEFEPPDTSRSELLEFRNRRVHGVDAVRATATLPTAVRFYGGGDATLITPSAKRTTPSVKSDRQEFFGGSFAVSTLTHSDRDHFDIDVAAVRQEGRRWDMDKWKQTPGAYRLVFSKSVTDTATSIRSLRDLLRRQARDERIRELPPERRALFERIRAIRERIPPSEFNSLRILRELRQGG